MSCGVDRFTITKNTENTFVFTIKADSSTLPLEIDVNDQFQYKLIELETEQEILTGSLTVEDYLNGKVSLTLSESSVNALTKDRGNKTDGYYLRPVYKLMLICDTANNGKFIAKVPKVYVD